MISAVSYNGVNFLALGLNAGLPADAAVAGPDATALTLARGNVSPIALGVTRGARTLTLRVRVASGSQDRFKVRFHELLGLIAQDDEEHALVVKLDLTGDNLHETEAQVQATFLSWALPNVNLGTITFSVADPLWRALTATTVGPQAFTANGNMTVNNTGLARVPATITITPDNQRSSGETALIGWKYQAPIVITNDSDEDWTEALVPVWWGDTTGLTTTKAAADGADVRVWRNGQVIRRQLQNWDTLATMLVFPVTIPRGQTATYWLVYGNPQASTAAASDPEFLELDSRGGTRPGYAAPDLGSASGTATGGSATTIVQASAGWEVNRWRGGFAWAISGTGAAEHQVRRILSNTADTITVARAFTGTAPGAGTVYVLWMSGIAMDGGAPSSQTATSLTDSSQSGLWGADQWLNAYLVIEAGTGAGNVRVVTASTSTGTVSWSGSLTVDSTSRYRLIKPGYQTYMVDPAIYETDWRGLWRINNYFSSPERSWYGDAVPGGMIPFTRFQNEDNFAQPSSSNYGSGGGHAQNWRPNGRIRRQVRQDRHYGEHKQADGFSFTDPRGVDGVQFDYQLKNESGICAFVFGVQESSTPGYSDLVTDSTTYASLTDVAAQWVNLTGYGPPVHLAWNLGPADGELIPTETSFDDEAEWRTKTRMEIWLNPATTGGRSATRGYTVVGTEEAAYDLNVRVQRDTRIIQVGGVGRHLMVPLDESLVIRTDPDTTSPVAAIEAASVLQERTPWAVRFLDEETDLDGATVERVARRPFVLLPGSNTLDISETAIGDIDVTVAFTRGWYG